MDAPARTKMGIRLTADAWCTEQGVKLIVNWARRGLTHREIAEKIGINEDTLLKWRKRRKQIHDAIEGREHAMVAVEDALYRECLGYYYTEQVVTNKGEIVEITKYNKPSLPAQVYFLKNRLPKYWKDKREVDYTEEAMHKMIVKWGEQNGHGNTSLPSSSSSKEPT